MGTLYRNGVPYIGSGGAGGVEVTQAEYDALPTSEKMNGSIYFITDGSVSYPTASQMRYDNTESGIPSTSVQGAIDELKIEIGDTDISSIGDGTLSGAISELNNGLSTTNGNLSSLTNNVWEWETFQGTVGGVAQTFYRKRLGNVYIMFGAGSVNVAIGAGATSQRQIVYTNKPFTAVYGGAANLSVSGQVDSQARYVAVGFDRVDAWLYNPATTAVPTMSYNFIVIGIAS